MPRKAATALGAVLVFFDAGPAVLADANNQTDHHGLSAQRPVFGYAFIFLDNSFLFFGRRTSRSCVVCALG